MSERYNGHRPPKHISFDETNSITKEQYQLVIDSLNQNRTKITNKNFMVFGTGTDINPDGISEKQKQTISIFMKSAEKKSLNEICNLNPEKTLFMSTDEKSPSTPAPADPIKGPLKVSGTINYEIEFENDMLRVKCSDSDEIKLVVLHQAFHHFKLLEQTIKIKEHKDNYTVAERVKIVSARYTIHKAVESFARKVFSKMVSAMNKDLKTTETNEPTQPDQQG